MEGIKSVKKNSDGYYDRAWRWIEDTYLKYFGENRTSYGVKDTLRKGEVSGNKDIDGAQRQVSDAVGGQFGKGGVGESVGSNVDKEILRGNV
ncbi:hypothetical protein L207DRAFT_413493 [Hyaloscypha variabilis F]|uniref:Uncharacterized protein n=1 Tax=Hyaloscypha variabilis (strain UAMH 11265 / GT02V1 / F) TaxID=1149755 RepID=A0A2J6SDG3_HYAVF|nr:hypothetical protein L207DRAFT_413493 [Hyaloscypha variabilis F]